jgi:hypothetical protein
MKLNVSDSIRLTGSEPAFAELEWPSVPGVDWTGWLALFGWMGVAGLLALACGWFVWHYWGPGGRRRALKRLQRRFQADQSGESLTAALDKRWLWRLCAWAQQCTPSDAHLQDEWLARLHHLAYSNECVSRETFMTLLSEAQQWEAAMRPNPYRLILSGSRR